MANENCAAKSKTLSCALRRDASGLRKASSIPTRRQLLRFLTSLFKGSRYELRISSATNRLCYRVLKQRLERGLRFFLLHNQVQSRMGAEKQPT